MSKTEVIIVAAGKGKRLKSKIPKAFIHIAGKPLVFYSLKAFQSHPGIKKIILVVDRVNIGLAERLIKKYKFSKVKVVVAGGKERTDSVKNGLRVLDKDTDLVLIHDCARPFVKKELISRILGALKRYKAVIPGFPAQDTLKYTNASKIVKNTLKREDLYHIQTPQGFQTSLLPVLLKTAIRSKAAYDDALLVEHKEKVKIVPSDPANIKITTPNDLMLSNSYLSITL